MLVDASEAVLRLSTPLLMLDISASRDASEVSVDEVVSVPFAAAAVWLEPYIEDVWLAGAGALADMLEYHHTPATTSTMTTTAMTNFEECDDIN